jgi:hypothetical protein
MNGLVPPRYGMACIQGEKGRPMPGKRVQFDDETWAAIELLARDTMGDFQELADEAFRDLLAKHGRPVGLKDQLKRSLRSGVKAEGDSDASGTPSSGRKESPARTAKRGRKNDAA